VIIFNQQKQVFMKMALSYFKTNSVALLLLLCGGLVAASCNKDDDSKDNGNANKQSFSSSFTKSDNAVQTSATGTLTATFDPGTMNLSYSVNWHDLSSKAVGMHIHDNGPIIIPIEGLQMDVSGSFSGTAKLTAEQAADLSAGKLYVQIHTENFPSGEVIAPFTSSSSNPGTNPNPGGGY
jgi:hypothetical protein